MPHIIVIYIAINALFLAAGSPLISLINDLFSADKTTKQPAYSGTDAEILKRDTKWFGRLYPYLPFVCGFLCLIYSFSSHLEALQINPKDAEFSFTMFLLIISLFYIVFLTHIFSRYFDLKSVKQL